MCECSLQCKWEVLVQCELTAVWICIRRSLSNFLTFQLSSVHIVESPSLLRPDSDATVSIHRPSSSSCPYPIGAMAQCRSHILHAVQSPASAREHAPPSRLPPSDLLPGPLYRGQDAMILTISPSLPRPDRRVVRHQYQILISERRTDCGWSTS